jgi:3-isopropylmalate/(R)-2-methylmalate dehydratase small subunit
MQPFTLLQGVVATLLIDNIDTDAIIPSKETQSVVRTGYGEKLFSNWRYLPGSRKPNPNFVLNQPPFTGATILVSGRNFGCGSSREAAVWALAQFGIRAIIAESFGAIFRNNCIRNGVLPISLPHETFRSLQAQWQASGSPHLSIDLQKQLIQTLNGGQWNFEIGALDRETLLQGLDEIAVTLKRREEIQRFREKDRLERSWLYPDPPTPR